MRIPIYALLTISLVFFRCSQNEKQDAPTLYTEVAQESGLLFNNALSFTEEMNPYTFRNFFNGGGVALGDINNDGLTDVYLTGNLVGNKLFLNLGNLQFKDITQDAGVGCEGVWSTGATFVDINADGLLDIYVCKSGLPKGKNRHNELFINQGDNTFKEASVEYGLNIKGLSIHAAFFDYDKDGDLDMYLLNNSSKPVSMGFDIVEDQRYTPAEEGTGNMFFRNDDGQFVDVTEEAKILNSAIGFGLGITVSDFNNDTWPDIFISNDFFERDYLYLNQKDGTFQEAAETFFGSLSMGAMGADCADLDNDGRFDLFVTEMLPETVERRRTKMVFEPWNKYAQRVSKGYHHQFPRNTLQQNTEGGFLEVGRFSEISATEWSWGALLFDMNNDGLRDIFVSNGIYKDLLDRDYLNFTSDPRNVRALLDNKYEGILELLKKIPSKPVQNAFFRNNGAFEFDRIMQGSSNAPSFSNGSAYADLDNDGDLDIVTNNLDTNVFLYQNNTDTTANYLIFSLKGKDANTFAIGAKVCVYYEGIENCQENYPSRGFQSSVSYKLHFGVGASTKVDSIVVLWPDNTSKTYHSIEVNTAHTLDWKEANQNNSPPKKYAASLKKVDIPVAYHHKENTFNDFDRHPLLFQMQSNLGPKIAVSDINGDGETDIFVGNAKNAAAELFISTAKGYTSVAAIQEDSIPENAEAVFFDYDSDGDQDLLVVNAGKAFSMASDAFQPRMFVNKGGLTFTVNKDILPRTTKYPIHCVEVGDFDGDGDLDVFIGEGNHPFYYEQHGGGRIFENNNGQFKDITALVATGLDSLGVIMDAQWGDLNGDGLLDLVVVGEWLPIKVYLQENGSLVDKTLSYFGEEFRGWWNTIELYDVNGDGRLDILAGNHGLNSFFKAPVRMYQDDFDGNGRVETIICTQENEKFYPILDKDELLDQLPSLKKRFLRYSDFGESSVDDIFGDALKTAKKLEVNALETSVFINKKEGFEKIELPKETQYTPIYAILAEDVNEDGYVDLIVGGNQYLVKPQFGRFDGLNGLIIFGGPHGFKNVEFLKVKGQIRSIKKVIRKDKKLIVFGLNNKQMEFYEVVE